MRIAVSSVAFPGVALAELPARAAEVGAQGLALTISENGSLPLNALPSVLRDLQRKCEDASVQISAIYGYAGRGMLAERLVRENDIELATRCIDVASQLHCDVVRLFAWKERPTPDLIDRYVEAARPVATYATAAGVRLGIPTHHDLAFDPASCRKLVTGLGLCSAFIIFNGQSLESDGIEPVSALREMFDVVGQVELKDWRRSGREVVPMPIQSGEATVMPVVEELAALGFGGWLTLHHLRQHHPELPALDPQVSTRVRQAAARVLERRSHHVQ